MSAKAIVDKALAANVVVVFSKTYCPFCTNAKNAIKEKGIVALIIELDTGDVNYDGETAPGADVHEVIKSTFNHRTVPAVFIKGKLLGGCDDTMSALSSGKFEELVKA
eukprot:gene4146-6503_t